MNRYEAVILDKIVDIWKTHKDGVLNHSERTTSECEYTIAKLLDCIVDFREPPGGTPVEDGCGAMVDKGASK